MKIFTKLIALLIALLMIGSCMVACADEKDPETDLPDTDADSTNAGDDDEDEDKEPEEQRILPDIPETYDFGEKEVSFLYWYVEAWTNTVRYCRDIYSAEITGEQIPDTVYSRNADIEEAYNVKITLEMASHDRVSPIIINQNSSGDNTYLVTVPRLAEQAGLVVNGAFHNLYDVNHIDLEKPWWDQNSVSQLSSNETLNLAATALMVNDKDATAALAFNKQAAADAELDDMYQMVLDGVWTYETVADIAEETTREVNGDDVMDEEDFWGFLGKNDVATSFFHGSGGLFVSKNADDEFIFVFGEDEKDIDATETFVNYLMTEDFFYNHHTTGIDDDEYTELFTSGNGLLFWMRLDEVTNMRGSETNFGILPIPKYDEYQENYHSTVSQHTTGLLSIPLSTAGDDLDMAGMILEALSAHSYYDLQYEYIDVSLKGRYARDNESEGMLDIILANRVFDPGCIFDFGNFAGSYQNQMSAGNNVASFLATMRDKTEAAIEDFNETIFEN